MDKRWIYILIILIIGISCLFLIVETGDTVGKANVNVGKFTLPMLDSFNVEDSSGNGIIIINKKTKERILIKDLGTDGINKTRISERTESFRNDTNNTNVENTNITINNTDYPCIYYERLPDKINRMCYITKFNHTFLIECTNFHNDTVIIDYVNTIVKSIKIDYKQKQD